MMCNMEPDMKAQIVKVIDKILSDGQLIYSKLNMLETDPIDGSKILEKLEKIKDVIEDLCQMELIDATGNMFSLLFFPLLISFVLFFQADAKMPKIVSAFSLSPSNLSTTTSIAVIKKINLFFRPLNFDFFYFLLTANM